MEKDFINYQKFYPNIEKALRDGAEFYAFLSGGGLRVVRIMKDDQLLSYGEHPHFSGALSHADQDFGLSYEQQYLGDNPKHLHYLTGAYPMPFDVFDIFLKTGKTFTVIYSVRWSQFVCTIPSPSHMRRNNEILWGSSTNLLGAVASCLISFMFQDKEEFEKRIHWWCSLKTSRLSRGFFFTKKLYFYYFHI